MFLKLFLWSSFVGIMAFFGHKQLSTQVVTFEQTIFIPGCSTDGAYEYFKDVKNSMRSIQNGNSLCRFGRQWPPCFGFTCPIGQTSEVLTPDIHGAHCVSDVVFIPGDAEQPDQIKFNRLEKFSIQGLYEQVLESPCLAKLFPSTPKIQMELNFFDGLIHGTVNMIFKPGSQNGQTGTIVTEYFEIVTPNFFAKFIQDNTKTTYNVFLQNAKRHLQDTDT